MSDLYDRAKVTLDLEEYLDLQRKIDLQDKKLTLIYDSFLTSVLILMKAKTDKPKEDLIEELERMGVNFKVSSRHEAKEEMRIEDLQISLNYKK